MSVYTETTTNQADPDFAREYDEWSRAVAEGRASKRPCLWLAYDPAWTAEERAVLRPYSQVMDSIPLESLTTSKGARRYHAVSDLMRAKAKELLDARAFRAQQEFYASATAPCHHDGESYETPCRCRTLTPIEGRTIGVTSREYRLQVGPGDACHLITDYLAGETILATTSKNLGPLPFVELDAIPIELHATYWDAVEESLQLVESDDEYPTLDPADDDSAPTYPIGSPEFEAILDELDRVLPDACERVNGRRPIPAYANPANEFDYL